MTSVIKTILLLSCLALAPYGYTLDISKLSARDFVAKSESRYKGDDMASIMSMVLTNKNGDERRRQFLWLHVEREGLAKDMQKFIYPRSIKDVSTLNEEVVEGEDLQYLYLPAAKKLRRVSSRHQSWVGSDLIFEDLQELKLDEWNYNIVGSESIEGHKTITIELVATSDTKSSYSKKLYSIRTDGTFYPSKIVYFDKNGDLLKTLTRTEVQDYNGALLAKNIKIHNKQDGHKTQLTRDWCKVNTDIPATLMMPRALSQKIDYFKHPQGLQDLLAQYKP